MRVSILADGTILDDGQSTDLASLEKRFAALAQQGGEVWYYRENPTSDPHPNAVAVIELVVKSRLPITMSTKPDFSDYVDENGNSRPRH